MKFNLNVIAKRKTTLFLLILFVFFAILFGSFFRFLPKEDGLPKQTYSFGYRLVNEKIPQSSPIKILLPFGVSEEYAIKNIKFDPPIKGQWLFSDSPLKSTKALSFPGGREKIVVFKPQDKLALDSYYSVTLYLPDGNELKSDFLVVDDPHLVNVFPSGNNILPNSEITFVFNRPVVPLTNLDNPNLSFPVEISPIIEGKFRWISTNVLQFTPKDGFKLSSHYKFVVKDFKGVDDVIVKGGQYDFYTEKIKLTNVDYVKLDDKQQEDKVLILEPNKPLRLIFDQPVDIVKLAKGINIKDSSGVNIPIILEYESKEKRKSLSFNFKTKGENKNILSFFINNFKLLLANVSVNLENIKEKDIDKKIVLVFSQKNKFDREKFWDYNRSYTLSVTEVYPLDGNLSNKDLVTIKFKTLDVINPYSIFQKSVDYDGLGDYFNFDNPDKIFDPKNYLIVSFYEDINLEKSEIFSKALKDIKYFGTTTNKIMISFDDRLLKKGEIVKIYFNKIFSQNGLLLNEKPIVKSIYTYPELNIIAVYPSLGQKNVSPTNLIVCLNNKLKNYEKDIKIEDFIKIESEQPISINYISNYYFYEDYYYSDNYDKQILKFVKKNCSSTNVYSISYKLLPFTRYKFNLKLTDVYDQVVEKDFDFTTGDISQKNKEIVSLFDRYSFTTPEKTKIKFVAKNIRNLNLEICKMKPEDYTSFILWKKYDYENIKINNLKCSQLVKDYFSFNNFWAPNYINIDLKEYFKDILGHYVIVVSSPDYQDGVNIHFLTISNLAVVLKKIDIRSSIEGKDPFLISEINKLNNIGWVVELPSLKMVSNAQVTVFNDSNVKIDQQNTNEKGEFFLSSLNKIKAILVQKGNSSVIVDRDDFLNYIYSDFSVEKIYVYTDKPIYRPSQEVFIKGIVRIGYDGKYDFPKKISYLTIENSRGQEVFTKSDVLLNENGGFNVNFILPQDAPLGVYMICVKTERYRDCPGSFEVEEYVPAAFKVEVISNKDEYLISDDITLRINANYYFGLPVKNADVEYSIMAQDYYFDRYDDYRFRFGDHDYYFYDCCRDKYLGSYKTKLDENGQALINLSFKNNQILNDLSSKIIVVEVTVKNELGQSISQQKSFILHWGNFYLGLRSDRFAASKNKPFKIFVKSVDTNGKPLSVSNINIDIIQNEWISEKRQEADGNFYYNWERRGNKLKSFNIRTDKNGESNFELVLEKEGEYKIVASAFDLANNKIFSSYYIYVYGDEYVESYSSESYSDLKLETAKKEFNVEEEAEIVINSPFRESKAIISIERGKIFEYWVLDFKGNINMFKFKIKPEYAPNIFVSVVLISPRGELKFGLKELGVNTERYKINIQVESNKKFYLPGEEVILNIQTTNWLRQPISAEVSLAVVDLSILALKGNPKKNPLAFFYDGFPLTILTDSNLKNLLKEYEYNEDDDVGKGGSGGILISDLESKKRGIFKETAFWLPVIKTDQQGKAKIKFKLPDNLTTWQIEAIGITKDTKLGVGYNEFKTQKKLMAISLKPRFIVPDDDFLIGVQIFNNSTDVQKLNVRIETKTLIINDESEKKVTIKPNDVYVQYFRVKAPANYQVGSHQFTISVIGNNYRDIVESNIRILPDSIFETVAASSYIKNNLFKEVIYFTSGVNQQKGHLKLKFSGSLAVFINKYFDYLISFPYGCTEQLASQLNAIYLIKRVANTWGDSELIKYKLKHQEKLYSLDELVNIGLAKIYSRQKANGSFSFWENTDGDFYLTLYVLEVLNNLKKVGYSISEEVFNRGINYSLNNIDNKFDFSGNQVNTYSFRETINLAYRLNNLFGNLDKFPNLRNKLDNIIDSDYFKKDISNSELLQLAIIYEKNKFSLEKQAKIFNLIDNKIQIDSRGAFMTLSKNYFWQFYETKIKNTALYLKLKILMEKDDEINGRVLRWLLAPNNNYDLASTQDMIEVMGALAEYLDWKKEPDSNFNLEVFLNGKSLRKFEINRQNIFKVFEVHLPINSLKINDNNLLKVIKIDKNKLTNAYYYDSELKYYLKANQISRRDEGFSIFRGFYRLIGEGTTTKRELVNEAKTGEILLAKIKIIVPELRRNVAIEDYLPAGVEIVNLKWATEKKSLSQYEEEEYDQQEYQSYIDDYDGYQFPKYEEMRDDRLFLFFDELPPGVYEYEYFVRALIKGRFLRLPSLAWEMYFPENFGRTSAEYFEIE